MPRELSTTSPSGHPSPSHYVPAIDGLRAVAVTSVILFHAFPAHITGGFIGVDIFFVISGFLITNLLHQEIKSGVFSLHRFYERRIRRLLPAFTVVLAATLLAGLILLLPVDNRALNMASLSTLLVASNVHFWMHTGYFAPNADSLPLLHTWSLAVEEQFYIIFPMFLYTMHKLAQPRLLISVALIAITSFAICLWGTFYKPGATFYLTPFRSWELLLGALIALGPRHLRLSRPMLQMLGVAGAEMIFGGVILVHNEMPFPGIGAVPAVVGAAAIIMAASSSFETLTTRLLACQPLPALGLISYPLYLWHWPVLVFARELSGGPLELLTACLALGLILSLSIATYYLVERPVRKRQILICTSHIFIAAGITTLLVAEFNLTVLIRDGYLVPPTPEVRARIDLNRHEVNAPMDGCTSSNYRRPIENAEDVVLCNVGTKPTPPAKQVLFWGDSFMEHLLPAMVDEQRRGGFAGRQMVFAISHGCQPTPGLERRERGYWCEAFNRSMQLHAKQPDVEAVVIGGAWRFEASYMALAERSGRRADSSDLTAEAERELIATIGQLLTAGKKVALIQSFPVYPVDIPRYLTRKLLEGKDAEVLLTRTAIENKNAIQNALLRRVAEKTGAAIFDPLDTLCFAGPCIYHDAMHTYYKDSGHLTQFGSRQLLIPLAKGLSGYIQ